MNRSLKIGLYLVSMLVLFWLGYVLKYAMGTADEYEIKGLPDAPSILIATQQSDYKDAISKQVLSHFKESELNFKLIDISSLDNINASQYPHIVIVHTWEYYKPPRPVKTFIQSLSDKDKVFTLSTSGDGNYKYDEVDGISSASRILSVEGDAESIIDWIENRLNPQP